MKVNIDSDEWYPVYALYKDYSFGKEVQVSIDFINRYDKLMDDFDKMQDELIKLYENKT